eukprot:2758759-Prymnesium_polylepis.1
MRPFAPEAARLGRRGEHTDRVAWPGVQSYPAIILRVTCSTRPPPPLANFRTMTSHRCHLPVLNATVREPQQGGCGGALRAKQTEAHVPGKGRPSMLSGVHFSMIAAGDGDRQPL